MTEIPLLSAAECAAARETVFALSERWIARHAMVPFFTLGTASYLDAGRRAPSYLESAERDNPMLREHFDWLHQRLIAALANDLGEPVALHPAFARPGFHVFQRCVIFEQRFASVHRDLQYKALPWKPEDEADFARPLSFTLAVSMPSAGAGLLLWDLHHDTLEGLAEKEVAALAAAQPPTYHPYRLGVLNVHSGHQLHQIAPTKFDGEGQERLTLQGHAIRCGGTWQVYW